MYKHVARRLNKIISKHPSMADNPNPVYLGINVGPLSQAGRAQLKPTGRRDVEAAIRQE